MAKEVDFLENDEDVSRQRSCTNFTDTKSVASGYWFCIVVKETDERPEMTSIAQNNMGTFSVGMYFIPVELKYAGTISD